LGKNVSAAVNAYSSAIMSISGFDEVIPLDQVIQTVSRVSKSMPSCVKCTGKGGLSITNTSIVLKRQLKERHIG
jgi:L-serine dehydratase